MLLQPLPYHLKVRDHFKQQTKTWEFFAAVNNKDGHLAEYKSGLLKNTYKFDPSIDLIIYNAVDKARSGLGLQGLSVTVYQTGYTDELNAGIVYHNNEAHIVFSGPLTTLLDEKELTAVIAHELTHVKLYSMLDGDLEIADRIISAIANNPQSEPAHYETARLYKLYTEIFCDRGAYSVIGETAPAISGLVKATTGLAKVSAESYLRQAEEIFAEGSHEKTSTVSHPENYIRARALQLWHNKKEAAEDEIVKMIEGIADIDQLDIFRQQELANLTREFLQLFLKPKWMQGILQVSHAKNFFTDFSLSENSLLTRDLTEKIAKAHNSIRDYLGYLLLDFALADSSIEEAAFGWAFQFSEDVALKNVFEAIVKKELNHSDKKLLQHRSRSLTAFYEVNEKESEQIYE
ncbi:M48 family metalloprotease [Ferruginibacter sp. HRS2-29]|uniref:M48 family metalloprotease n=1 Tax=Ferruginibacter sp. HRS2-29 TaxID=2487334 RepID=UPI0020CF82BB|nr:M48 family metalloprotease [Ferruginibacter sp. HRS2-29]MCP9752086.1 peptidase M48 [Ferruginibacter sp. HRS2-29]